MNHPIELTELVPLYQKYRSDLNKVRAEQAEFYQARGYLPDLQPPLAEKLIASARRVGGFLKGYRLLKPQLDDVEAEVTYLLLRHFQPETIVEVSPCGGWSSTWILKAIRDNGKGHLYSFDLIDDSVKNIPIELARGRRTFIQGKIQDRLASLPPQIDYLFVDSDHSAQFAKWYIENLFPRLKVGTPVSVHDVFHTDSPSGFDGEGGVVVDWLDQRKISFFTASPAKNPSVFKSLMKVKGELGLQQKIHRSSYNSMIYFLYNNDGNNK